MRTDEEFVRRIDEWRRLQPDLPSRSEAIRRLVGLGIMYSGELAMAEKEAGKREIRRARRGRSIKVENLNAENDG
jgi:hypothetical protein